MSFVPSARTISALSLATMSGGVPAGTITPNQVVRSNPGSPDSAMVGSSGTAGERASVVTASARSLPALTLGSALARLSNINCTCPESKSAIAGAAPL
jgi:hypothetical protein